VLVGLSLAALPLAAFPDSQQLADRDDLPLLRRFDFAGDWRVTVANRHSHTNDREASKSRKRTAGLWMVTRASCCPG
jgi:hypothetical protein